MRFSPVHEFALKAALWLPLSFVVWFWARRGVVVAGGAPRAVRAARFVAGSLLGVSRRAAICSTSRVA